MSALLFHSARVKPPLRCPPSFDRRSRDEFVRRMWGKTGAWVWQARVWFDRVVHHVHLGLDREERAVTSAVDAGVRAVAEP